MGKFWPQATDYSEAIQNLPLAFRDPEIRAGQAVQTPLGLPLVCTGSFAAVFKVCSATGDRHWAVRCLTHPVRGLEERYRQIAGHLEHEQQRQRLPFMVGFRYLPDSVRVDQRWYPFLKMDWVEGLRLDEFLADCLAKRNYQSTLNQLGGAWLRLGQWLRKARIAHGDLQHGNILLVPVRETRGYDLVLIDYDGMCVPALASSPAPEFGHPAYQHPARLRGAGYGPEMDRFSQLVIYCTLRCLGVGGRELWARHHDSERLLLGPRDFESPQTSATFRELWRLPDPPTQTLVGHLILAAQRGLDEVPLLEDLVQGTQVVPLSADERRQIEHGFSPKPAGGPEQRLLEAIKAGTLPTDLYQLLGHPLFQRDQPALLKAVQDCHRALHKLQNHADHRVTERVDQLKTQVAGAQEILADEEQWRQYDDGLGRQLAEQYAAEHGRDASRWRPEELGRWLAARQVPEAQRETAIQRLLAARRAAPRPPAPVPAAPVPVSVAPVPPTAGPPAPATPAPPAQAPPKPADFRSRAFAARPASGDSGSAAGVPVPAPDGPREGAQAAGPPTPRSQPESTARPAAAAVSRPPPRSAPPRLGPSPGLSPAAPPRGGSVLTAVLCVAGFAFLAVVVLVVGLALWFLVLSPARSAAPRRGPVRPVKQSAQVRPGPQPGEGPRRGAQLSGPPVGRGRRILRAVGRPGQLAVRAGLNGGADLLN